jgi:hypothetical protein
LYDYGARWYDPAVARWTSVDPLADHPNQIMMSPYQYAWGDPVSLTDPDGRCPNCASAAIGATIGLVVGIGVSMWNQRNNESYDMTQILIDGGKGALTGGLIGAFGPGAIASAGTSVTATTAEGILINATVSAGATGTSDMLGQMAEVATGRRSSDDISLVETGENMVLGGISGGAGGYIGGKIQAATSASSPKAVSEIRAASSGNGARAGQRAAVKKLGPNPTNAQVRQARSTARAETRGAAYDRVHSRAKVYSSVGTAAGASSTNASKQTLNQLKDWARGN